MLNRITHYAPLLLIMALASGCAPRELPEPTDQSVRPARIYTLVAQATREKFEYVGHIEAAQTIDVSFEVSGPLLELSVREGQTLAAGELIAAIDPRDFNLAVREAQLQVRLAKQDLERKRLMLEQRGIARSLVDDAEANFQLQRVRLAQANESRKDAQVRAPFAAIVSERYVDNRVNVRPGQPIVRLQDMSELIVVVNIPQRLLARVSTDQVGSFSARFPTQPESSFALTYRENRGEADRIAQTYAVSFTLQEAPKWNLLPGMTASVQVELNPTELVNSGLFVPSSALVSTATGELYVWQYNTESGAVTRRQVVVGTPTPQGVPVISGLRPNDAVVASGASQLQDGMRVRPLVPTVNTARNTAR